jgi:pimeloyl-ACP methyl ester carboxylesterase
MIEWHDTQDPTGAATREFRISRTGKRDITGAVWLPERAGTLDTLMCFGHGASGDRYQPPICYLAGRFTGEPAIPVLSIDGPVHGLRQAGEGGREAFFPEFRREDALRDMTEDWTVAIDAARQLPQVGATRLAYFGLSMGSIFGFPMIASRDDVIVAVLGLFGVQDSFPHGDESIEAAAKITCPVLYLMQLEDEIFSREGYLEAFDALATQDKRIHANPGLHPEVPAEEMEFAFDFLLRHIEG